MKFVIDEIILWPQNRNFAPRTIKFEEGKINIIHGLSGTGKSSILYLVDFVLGSSKCQIPVGIIRRTVSWFGLKVRIKDNQYVIARKSPEKSQVSSEFYISSQELNNLDAPKATHTHSQFKARLNEIVSLDGVDISDTETKGSYRNLAAFNFLPQHIVASPNSLFFKTETYASRENLTKSLPYALGMVTSKYLTDERQKDLAIREQTKLKKDLKQYENTERHLHEQADYIYKKCIDTGLLASPAPELMSERVEKLSTILAALTEGRLEKLIDPQRKNFPDKLETAIKATSEQQKLVNELDLQLEGLESLIRSSGRLAKAVETEKSHVIGLEWLKKSLTKDSHCVACGSLTHSLPMVIDNLEKKINKAPDVSSLIEVNSALEKQILKIKRKRGVEGRNLSLLRSEQHALIRENKIIKDSFERIYFVAGEINSLLNALEKTKDKKHIISQLEEIERTIRKLDLSMAKVDRTEQERKIDAQLTPMIGEYADQFPLNAPQGAEIVFDRKELTLRFDVADKSDYLWEIGSNADYMGYHIATFLAIHEHLSKSENQLLPPFSFLIIDQPSQVYFPSNASESSTSEEINKRTADILATRRIFEVLASALENSNQFFQIIILEHAGPDIWEEVPYTVSVESWEKKGDGLIPSAWIQDMP